MTHASNTRRPKMKEKAVSSLQPAQLDAEKFKQLYAGMLRCRMLTEQMRTLNDQGRLDRAMLPETGEEAIEAGMLADLRPDDRVAPGSCSVHTRLLRGEPVRSIIAELLRGKLPSPRKTDPGVRAIIPSGFALPAQMNLASGAAWAFQTSAPEHVAITFSREDSIASEFWIDAVNFSALNKLPLVHVVQTAHREGPVAAATTTFGIQLSVSLPTLTVDGNDAVAVYRVGQEAVRRARQGRGPSLILCESSACPGSGVLGNHSPDLQKSADPLGRLEGYLRQRASWSENWERGLVSKFSQELARAVNTADKSRLRVLPSDRSADSVLASVG